jgi:hypothetical protein
MTTIKLQARPCRPNIKVLTVGSESRMGAVKRNPSHALNLQLISNVRFYHLETISALSDAKCLITFLARTLSFWTFGKATMKCLSAEVSTEDLQFSVILKPGRNRIYGHAPL